MSLVREDLYSVNKDLSKQVDGMKTELREDMYELGRDVRRVQSHIDYIVTVGGLSLIIVFAVILVLKP